MILEVFNSAAISLSGLVLFFLLKAIAYIAYMEFSFSKWRKENSKKFILSLILCIFASVISSLKIISISSFISLFGIQVVSIAGEGAIEFVLGYACGSFVYKGQKVINHKSNGRKETDSEKTEGY